MSDEPICLFPNDPDPLPNGQFYIESEDRLDRGWRVIVRWRDCPAGCSNGDVWGGDEPVNCSTCQGAGSVPVGIGGALVFGCYRFTLPADPGIEMYRVDLRYFMPAEGLAS